MIGFLAAVGMLAICLILLPASGWWFAMRLSGGSLLRFTAACLAGVTALAVAELLVYVLRAPQWGAVAIVAIVCAVGARDLVATVRRGEFAWDALLTWGGASAILIAATIPYGTHGTPGALWDWYEHWLRSLIFLQQGPVTTRIGIYILPARGPLFNAAAAVLLYLAGSAHYWVFQIAATTFNLLACLPFALVLESIGGLRRRRALLAAALVVVGTPFFFWNNTFTWTKDLTAAFVLMGIYSYFIAYRKGRRDQMALSLAYLAPGFLCHYLALLYAALLGLHLLLVVPVREWPVRSLIRAGLVWGLLIAPWFGYMFLSFGIKRTLGANTTVGRYLVAEDEHGVPLPQYRVMAANLCTDLLPTSACRSLLPPSGGPVCVDVQVDGTAVVQLPGTCPAGFNWTGIYSLLGYSGIAALALLLLFVRTASSWHAGEKTVGHFLLWVLGAGLILNLLPIRWFDPGGTFGENLHAWVMVFFAMLARPLSRLPKAALVALAVAMIAEYGSADVQAIRWQSLVLPLANHPSVIEGRIPLGTVLPDPAGATRFRANEDYYRNYQFKIKGGALYFRDLHPDSYAVVAWAMVAIGILGLAAGQRRHGNI